MPDGGEHAATGVSLCCGFGADTTARELSVNELAFPVITWPPEKLDERTADDDDD